jgi:hypothetical protein
MAPSGRCGKRVEERELHAVIDVDLRHQRIEDGRFLRDADDDAAGRARRRRLAEGGLAQQVGRDEAGRPVTAIVAAHRAASKST